MEDKDVEKLGIDGDRDGSETASRPKKRIVDSDDDEDELPVKPRARRSSPVLFMSDNDSNDGELHSRDKNDSESDDEPFSAEKFLTDYRKARLDALSAKVAAKNQAETEDTEPAATERSRSPAQSFSASPSASPSGRKQKVRKASKKALDEMHRETQRMARNMALRPEVKTSKKIEMSDIFAKFGFNPNKSTTQESQVESQSIDQSTEPMIEKPTVSFEEPLKMSIDPPAPVRYTTPNLDDSDSDESLPSPSKIALFLPKQSEKPPTPPKSADKPSTPRKVHFTLPPSPSSSDSDSDVEILPPQSLLTTHATTPDRKRIKRTALIRSLANLKSPVQTRRSPGRMTQKELDVTLSREAAVQAARKREERRAELKSLGIDTERIVEKRDLLEEAREEARRVREEEGGEEESDEEYFDEEENDADEESGNDSGEDEEMGEESEEEEMGESDVEEDDVPTKRKSRVVQVLSDDDEDDSLEGQSGVVPESIIGSQLNMQQLPLLQPTDDLSMTQFFHPTQMSGSTENLASTGKIQTQSDTGTGMTQFFTSTAIDDDLHPTGEDAAHNRMELLRQKAGQGVMSLGEESIGFPGALSPPISIPLEPLRSPNTAESEPEESPVRRRILKRRTIPKEPSNPIPKETSEEFIKSRKEFIEEQAEESEDDYAAWRSGDESENENMDGVVEGLIDDDTKIKKNTEREVARLYM